MQVQWIFLALAVALLVPPLPLSESLRHFVLKSRRNASANIKSTLELWQNWVDLARAGLGVYVLTTLAIQVDTQVEGAALKALMLQGAILAIGIVVQSLKFSGEIRIIAPIFYISGITLMLPGIAVGGFAIFTGWLFGVGSTNPRFVLPVMGIALGAAGYVLGSLGLEVILNCGLIFLPMFLAFMARQPLVVVAREPKRMTVAA